MRELADRVAVVTGAASGIGRAMAERFASERMRVVLADVEEEPLAKVRAEIEGQGAQAIAVRTDVSDPAAVSELASRTISAFGGVHVVCNNAGVCAPGALWETSLVDWRWTVDVNLWGVVHGVRTFVPIMLEAGEDGHIVNTASSAGLMSGVAHLSAYSVTKHAVVAVSEALDAELAARSAPIKVSVICPLLVRTRITEAGRNRPSADDPTEPSDRSAMFWTMLDRGVAVGTPPEDVAALVVRAIVEEKLYVLPHPELKDRIRERMDAILEERSITP